MEQYLFLLGRVIFGGYFLLSAFNHFSKGSMLAQYASSKGVPAPLIAVYGTGFLLLIGGLGVLSGVYVKWALFALVLFLGAVSLKMHAFWAVADPQMKMMEQINFMKNMALLGAALMMLVLPEPWFFSLPWEF